MRGKMNVDEFIFAHITWLDLAPAQFVEYSLDTPLPVVKPGCRRMSQRPAVRQILHRGNIDPYKFVKSRILAY